MPRLMVLMQRTDIEKNLTSLAASARARLTIVDARGHVLHDSDRQSADFDNHYNRPGIQEARLKGNGSTVRHSRSLDIDMLYVALPVKDRGVIQGYVRLARPLVEVKTAIDRLHQTIAKTFLIILVPTLLIAFLFFMRLTSSIQEMAAFTRRVRENGNPGTLLISSRDEIGQLAHDINFMVQELYEKIRGIDEERGKLEAAFASMIEGVVILDADGRIESVNQGVLHILGMPYPDILDKTALEVFRNAELQNAMETFRREKKTLTREIFLGGEEGLIVDVNMTSVHGLSGSDEKTMLVIHDVTKLKRLERMRVDFVANVTHEIKTPLTAIIGFIETLQEGALDNRVLAEKFLGTISENAQRLNRLVDDLLALSNIELGEATFRFAAVSLPALMKDLLPVIERKTAEKGITVDCHIHGDLPPIRGDRDRVVQIILNILDNAVKFTPESGRISIAAVLRETDEV
ncbi:MAG: PAS domain-containing protein, partial [Syntrophales bacterium LBB04]|nr:PAS domain-containing protein [Syntrophales bacterium LBB04]